MRALTKMTQFEPGTNLAGWLSTILTHLFIEKVRREARYRKLLAAYKLKHPNYSPANQSKRLEISALDNAIDELPDEQRMALTMVALYNASYAETARSAGVPVGTIRSRLSRARQALAISVNGNIRERRSPSAPRNSSQKNSAGSGVLR